MGRRRTGHAEVLGRGCGERVATRGSGARQRDRASEAPMSGGEIFLFRPSFHAKTLESLGQYALVMGPVSMTSKSDRCTSRMLESSWVSQRSSGAPWMYRRVSSGALSAKISP